LATFTAEIQLNHGEKKTTQIDEEANSNCRTKSVASTNHENGQEHKDLEFAARPLIDDYRNRLAGACRAHRSFLTVYHRRNFIPQKRAQTRFEAGGGTVRSE